ncbi:MAG: hypothetical protein GY935_22045 [Gammaproteobacteria bacterium]|nr:hypothetical protein [Gammaproteobacteria bacterium]
MGTINKTTIALVTLMTLASQSVVAADLERRQAKRIHDRLTGVSATNATIDAMEGLLAIDPSGKSAAEYAIDTAQNPNAYAFYNVTLKNYAAPWTNEEETVFTPLNDYSATVIGSIRDGLDFRRILYDDLLYIGNAAGIAGYSNSNNNHYEQLEALNPDPNAANSGNLANLSILQQTTQSSVRPGVAPAGIMTSRAGAMAFFSDGTNRAMFRFTLLNHLCTDIEPLKDPTRPADHVRRDVSRSPGGDSRIFMNGCLGCHAGMDGMMGAYAYYEWSYTNDKSDGSLVYDNSQPAAKHNINPNNFEYGHEVVDDHWINYWRNGPNSKLGNRPGDNSSGWSYAGEVLDAKGNAIGNGASSFGRELANSKAFAQCQVDKAFKSICLRDPNTFSADRSARDGFVTNFVGNNYDMREVFTDVAAYCKGS